MTRSVLYGPEFREGWGPGPWQDEPDQIIWRVGPYKCEIHRSAILGHLCGYIAIGRWHPAFKRRDVARDFEMHGGCTYAQREGNRWKIGFDCAHIGDLVPNIHFMQQPGQLLGDIHAGFRGLFNDADVYRDIVYVEQEIWQLWNQFELMRYGK